MNIIVTGASRGIGYELVKRFCHDADHRVMAISRNAQRLEKLGRECGKINPDAQIIRLPFDLASFGDIQNELAGQVTRHFDHLDILINNAGYLVKKNFQELTEQDFRKCLDVNYIAPAFLIKSMLGLLRKSPMAHVVNISSMGGVQGTKKFPGLSAYSASKAAVHILTECLAEEFAENRIAFNTLALGAVQTEMFSEAFPGYKAPLQAVEMAEYIAGFALKGNRFHQGKTLQVSISTP